MELWQLKAEIKNESPARRGVVASPQTIILSNNQINA